MSHDKNKILMGTHGSSGLESSCESGSQSTFKAGLAVRKASTGELSLASGSLIGVSLGSSLVSDKKVSVARSGNYIPLILKNENALAHVVIGASVQVSATTGEAVKTGVATGAVYVSGPLKGIEVGSTDPNVDVAYIDMPGGL